MKENGKFKKTTTSRPTGKPVKNGSDFKKNYSEKKDYTKKSFDKDKREYTNKEFDKKAPSPAKTYTKKSYDSKPERKFLKNDKNFTKPEKTLVKETFNKELDDNMPLQLEGRNAVLEALESGKTIDRILVKQDLEGIVKVIIAKAKEKGIVVQEVVKQKLDDVSQTGNHQGIVAFCPAHEYSTIEDMLALAENRNEEPFIIVLDEISDPHNLGAIIRTANACGAHGVIIPKRRAVGMTATVVRSSAGAVEYVPVARVTNIAQTIDNLKKNGLWIACADMDGEMMYDTSLTGPIALVIGNEGDGVGRLVKEKCDYIVSVPMSGKISSLNASVAAAVVMYEIVRQRRL